MCRLKSLRKQRIEEMGSHFTTVKKKERNRGERGRKWEKRQEGWMEGKRERLRHFFSGVFFRPLISLGLKALFMTVMLIIEDG